MDELKNTIITFISDGLIFWTLAETILIESVEFSSISHYLTEVIHELKLIYTSVKNYDPFTANCFKVGILEELKVIPVFNTPQVKGIYESIYSF
jgi:hypothetical protein